MSISLCTPEETVKRVIAGKAKYNWEECLKLEKQLREHPEKIPTWQVAGPLHYGMTPTQMREAILQKFKELVASGRIQTEKSLGEACVKLYPPTGKGDTNMTRVWGAEFLKSKLLGNTFDVAEHFLIIAEKAEEIEVEVRFSDDYPVLKSIKNGYVLSQKIEGRPSAEEYRNSTQLAALGFKDFKDSGNILCDANQKAWIVDTEKNSFDSPDLNEEENAMHTYLKRRFKVLSGKRVFQTFKISFSEIGLAKKC